jgi:hypothetical protein
MYQIDLIDTYTVPEGALTKEQYVNFVMNLACQSYMKQYNAGDVEDGLAMAVMAYNSSIPEPTPVPEV